MLKHPRFAGLDHSRVVREAVQEYGETNTERIKEAVLKHLRFAGLDHSRVVREAVQEYGEANTERIKEAVLKFPQFADLDHSRVVREAVQEYGEANTERIKEAVLKFPPFAGLDHSRVLRQNYRLGRLVGLSSEKVLDKILDNPVFASYSAKRYLAALDICRSLAAEGCHYEEMLQIYFSNISKSPYVPGTKRKRISQVADYAEPPLMQVMRKRLRGKMER